jgi:Ni,Fe-hydrogenase III small subunit/Pyruvate/2-oxoacid:ferredoxin oxidoreductase delta subunit
MFDAVIARIKQGHRTVPYPRREPTLPARFRGRPVLDPARCREGCLACVEACPTEALSRAGGTWRVDLGRCLFCPECPSHCPHGAISFSSDYRMATRTRSNLVVEAGEPHRAAPLDDERLRLFARSLKLRQVSAGGCNACEADTNVLTTVVFDLARFGVQFVASPRHADGLLITGPVPRNMQLALKKTWEAVPPPKVVVSVGACAISGGPFLDLPEVHNGAESTVPVDLYVPGCPPHPMTILDGILRLMGRVTG